jgi:hypothetical protein
VSGTKIKVAIHFLIISFFCSCKPVAQVEESIEADAQLSMGEVKTLLQNGANVAKKFTTSLPNSVSESLRKMANGNPISKLATTGKWNPSESEYQAALGKANSYLRACGPIRGLYPYISYTGSVGTVATAIQALSGKLPGGAGAKVGNVWKSMSKYFSAARKNAVEVVLFAGHDIDYGGTVGILGAAQLIGFGPFHYLFGKELLFGSKELMDLHLFTFGSGAFGKFQAELGLYSVPGHDAGLYIDFGKGGHGGATLGVIAQIDPVRLANLANIDYWLGKMNESACLKVKKGHH